MPPRSATDFGTAPGVLSHMQHGTPPDKPFVLRGGDMLGLNVKPGTPLEETPVETGGTLGDLCDMRKRSMVLIYDPAGLPPRLGGVIPFLRGTIFGHDVVYAPLFSPDGTVPATLCRSEGTTVNVWVALPDKCQLDILDAIHRDLHYDMVEINHTITLEGVETFWRPCAYTCPAGVLHLGGAPVRLGTVTAERPRFPAATGPEAAMQAARQLGFVGTPETVTALILERLRECNGRLGAVHSAPDNLGCEKLGWNTPPRVGDMERMLV